MQLKPTRNKLLTQEHRNQVGPHVDESRCSGRTTRRALGFIGEAMRQPNVAITVYDHHEPDSAHTKLAMLKVCQQLVSAMGLKHFEFSRNGYTVTCNLLEW